MKDTRKALSLVAAAFYGYPSRKLKIIGVTGTNGKTTVTRMLAAILAESGQKTGVIGTLGADFGARHMESDLTTPDPLYLQYMLSEMVKEGMDYCVAEISAHALFFDKEYGVEYAACIFTNCTQDHLDFFGTMARYAQAKKKLFCERQSGFHVLNADDPLGRALAADNPRAVTYAMKNPADVFAVGEEESAAGSLVLLNLCDELCECAVRMAGAYNVDNALSAAACAWKLGADVGAIARGLSSFRGVKGRLERAGKVNGAEIFVDFAHTPDGLSASRGSLKNFCRGRLFCLFGCGGNRDRGKRALMGKIASEKADFTIVTSDNPRFENPVAIMKEIEAGILPSARFVLIEDREQAICYAVRCLQEGDMLLVAGKGAEPYQEIMGIKYEYSDYTVIGAVIR